MQLMQAKQAQQEMQQKMQDLEMREKEGKINKAEAEAQRAMIQAKKGEAEIDGVFLTHIHQAVETAMSLAGMPNAGVTADRIMETALNQRDLMEGAGAAAAANAPPVDPMAQQPMPQPAM